MELQYEKALAKYKLKISDLPKDAQTGIKSIGEINRAIILVEKKGKKVNSSVMDRLKALDKWTYYEILDHVQGTDNNPDDKPDADEIIDDIDNEGKKVIPPTKSAKKSAASAAAAAAVPITKTDKQANNDNAELAIAIDEELKALFEAGQSEFTFDQLKSSAPKAYDVIFDGYDESETNGINTTHFSLMETEPEKFKLTKK